MNLLFFAFLCRICMLLVFLRSLVCFLLFRFCFLPFSFFPLIFFFFRFSLFSLFFASSFLFIRFKRFECFLHISRQLLSIVPQSSATGKLQKHEKRGYFAPTSSTPTLSETFQAMLLFQDSDPMNDPSSGLTNDTREDPITESHRPIAKNNSPHIF